MLRRLGLCINPHDKALQGIIKKARRAIDPQTATTPSSRAARTANREAILRSVRHDVTSSHGGLIPGFERNFAEGSQSVIGLSKDDLDLLGRKWMWGIYFCQYGQIVPQNTTFDIYFVSDAVAHEVYSPILEYGAYIHKGRNMQVAIFDAIEGSRRMTHFAFRIWGDFKVYGVIDIYLTEGEN